MLLSLYSSISVPTGTLPDLPAQFRELELQRNRIVGTIPASYSTYVCVWFMCMYSYEFCMILCVFVWFYVCLSVFVHISVYIFIPINNTSHTGWAHCMCCISVTMHSLVRPLSTVLLCIALSCFVIVLWCVIVGCDVVLVIVLWRLRVLLHCDIVP